MKAFIKHISYYVPEKKLTNNGLVALFPDVTAESIFNKTGIELRGVCEEDEISSDLAIKAGDLFFEEHPDVKKADIDFLIFCTQAPDYFTPTTACILQDRLGLRNEIGAYDLNMGCTGFVYGLSMAKGLIETNQAKNILLLNCEAITKILHPKDKAARMLFGDAAAAILVSGREQTGIGDFVFGTNGKKADIMMMKAGGKRYPLKDHVIREFEDEFGNISSDEFFYMKGTSVFSFTLKVAPKMVQDLLNVASESKEAIDYYVFHQANLYALKVLQTLLKIPDEKFCINLSNTGNTVSCTIPIALKDSLGNGKIKEGDKVMLVSFGVGASWAATIIIV